MRNYKIMLKLYSKIFTICLFATMFVLQGCSMFVDETGISGSSGIKVLGANENRRVPEKNPVIEDTVASPEIQKISESPYDDNQDAYQNYKANDSPSDFKTPTGGKRKPKLNVLELNKSMDKVVEVEKSQQAIAKPAEVTGQSNLNEIISYNKQQKAKSSNVKSSEAVISSSKTTNSNEKPVTVVSIKPPIELQTPKKEEKVVKVQPAKKKVNKASEHAVKAQVISPVKQSEPVKNVAVAAPIPKVEEKVKPVAIPVEEKSLPVKQSDPVKNVVVTAPIPKAEEKVKPVAVSVEKVPTSVKQSEPVKSAVVTSAAAPVKLSEVVKKSTQIPESEEDIRNLSHDEFKRALKEKFKKDTTTETLQKEDKSVGAIEGDQAK